MQQLISIQRTFLDCVVRLINEEYLKLSSSQEQKMCSRPPPIITFLSFLGSCYFLSLLFLTDINKGVRLGKEDTVRPLEEWWISQINKYSWQINPAICVPYIFGKKESCLILTQNWGFCKEFNLFLFIYPLVIPEFIEYILSDIIS